ncbi:dynein heavy chain domain-containing protein 1 [Notolabrus celidotus]|uniref:dynein heavy chain domain-containing protein 1 n=1 Tax=Notolabrus celidotus TaxID=1203425 RepID=UPI00148F64E7|nr:dynein heavy chain domain-containing protein 1 [Notolabrus celidotus]
MSAAHEEEISSPGASQSRDKDIARPGSKFTKKAHLPPLSPKKLSVSAAFVTRPLFGHAAILSRIPSHRPVSVVERPSLIAKEGSERAKHDTKRTVGPRLMASALGADSAVRAADESTAKSLAGEDESIKVTTCNNKKINTVNNGKATKSNKVPLTAAEVLHIFARKRDLGELELYYLKEEDGDSYRPYDLRVVHPSEAGSEHYVFSPNSVLHVTERGYGGIVSQVQWYRESMLWTALQEIPFFRDFRVQKAFTRWHKNVRTIIFQRKCEDLLDRLLMAVPQFRHALLLFTRVIEEVKGTHLLPQEESETYTLKELKRLLKTKNQERLELLEKLSQYRFFILNKVKEECYKAHQQLQLHMEYAKKPNKCCEPIHLHLAHQQDLKKESARSESVLKKLGNFALLINQMTVQSLVTIYQQDVMSFHNNILKRQKSEQGCLFCTELCFDGNSQLTVDPLIHLYQETVREALLTVGETIIQMCDTCGFFLESSHGVSSSNNAQDLTSDICCLEYAATTEHNKSDGMSDHGKFCCRLCLRDFPSHWLLLHKETSPMAKGNRVHGCFYPLIKEQLECQISSSDVSKQAEKEQEKIMQEAELEILQLCESFSWLLDIHLFTAQWSQASLESMKGQPTLLYDELLKKLRIWTEQICTVPSSVSTTNDLYIIKCSCIKENLGQQLRLIEEEVLKQLVEQIKLHSESLSSDLEVAAAKLKTEPRDIHELSEYALKVRESVKLLADSQKRLEYIHTLQNTLCMNYREMTEQEVTLEQKVLAMRDDFILLLKQAESIVCNQLPSMSQALHTMFSFLVRDLINTVTMATSGPFLDPAQNEKEMVATLNHMCGHVHNLSAKLENMSRTNQNLQEHPIDTTILTTNISKIKARKDIWELKAACKTWTEEWKELSFSEVVVSQAQDKIARWKEHALSLTGVIPTHDAVLQETLGLLESFSPLLAVMSQLQRTTLKQKHLKAIFKDMGLLYDPEKTVMVAELMSKQHEFDQTYITKICRAAQAESNMEQTFLRLQQGWEARVFQLDRFSLPVWQQCEQHHGLTEKGKPRDGPSLEMESAGRPSCDDARFIIPGLELLFAEIDNDLMTLSTMFKSPHVVEIKKQIKDWMQTLQHLGRLLGLFKRYQQIWAFLTKVFHNTVFCVQRVDLMELFKPVDETFKEIMHSLSRDPHVLNLTHPRKENDSFHGDGLYQILFDGLSTMEAISNQLTDQLDTHRQQCPRLWFLSDREVIQLLSLHPTAVTMQSYVLKCFKGVRLLEMDCETPSNTHDAKCCGASCQIHGQMKVLGFFGSLQEHIIFLSPLEPDLSDLSWLCVFENKMKLCMKQLMTRCAIARNQLEPHSQDLACDEKVGNTMSQLSVRREIVEPVLDLLSDYPLQCLLVVEEAVWCKTALQASQELSPVKLRNIKVCNSAKMKDLGRFIREGVTKTTSVPLISRYVMMCLRALVQLTMKHAQQLSKLMEVQHLPLETSFEWLSLMKYHISEDLSLKNKEDPTCFVDVLGHRLPYDHEYFGPDDLEMVHAPSTDRAILGILLALTSYRCGFVSGPYKTVEHLGKALGRQVVNVQCSPNMRQIVVQRMLLGALQTGAWLLLDSVDLLKQGVLSLLGQHLEDIHQSFSKSTRNRNQKVNEETKDRTADCKSIVDSECHMVLAGKNLSARLNYGCVLISSKGFQSEVPESLRCATRPIALTPPDYRIIAEVMLTSIGFTEATSLSRHLVSLINLARDSNCLPDFISDNQSGYLVVLQRIISAAEIHLEQCVRQREMSDEAKGSASEQTDLASSQNGIENDEKKREETGKRLRNSHLSVVQGLMEETAIVKAILSILLPFFYEQKKASQFYIMFKETFPIVSQFPFFRQHIEDEEKNQLKDAVIEELQRLGFQSDTEVMRSALTLYHTLKLSKAVMLLGPSGSGKTSSMHALAGALNNLAFYSRFEDNIRMESDKTPPLSWNSVDTVVLFPNAMSHEEVFGSFCEKRGWQDGAVSKVLRDLGQREQASTICDNRKTDHTPIMTWLVMDGEPVGQPGWFDHLTTLCSPDDPFLFLPSCETLKSQSHLKLLIETTDLRDASPSAVTRCSLMYFTGSDLWKAVWKSEVDALFHENKLEQETLKIWNRLAEDLFASTLSLIRENALTSAIHHKEESVKSPTYGVQEIMSFVRILRALLQHFGKEVEKDKQIDKQDKLSHRSGAAGTDSNTKQPLLGRNLFLLAYIWGFGGHLHSCHWPQFDSLSRQVLYACRYKIEIPDGENVFEHFFNTNSRTHHKNPLLTITPKYGKYTFLLDLMLEANQPVMLAGEPGSGKTTLCKTLLSFDKPHISLPGSPLLSSRDLRTLIENMSCPKSSEDTKGSMGRQPRLLLCVDDLHEAPCDVFEKTSTAQETLRQSISTGQILIYDTYHFKSLSSRCISYMATCRVFRSGKHHSNAISSRLSRLFSIFVLPSLCMDVIFSMHSPQLKMWLKEMPLKQSCEDAAYCIISATKSLYNAVCDQFQPTAHRPHFMFSHHDLQKVFLGMCLWQQNTPNTTAMQGKENSPQGCSPVLPGPVALSLDIAHLWAHECMRTFSDRLCSEDERNTLVSLISKTATTHYRICLTDEAQPASLDDTAMTKSLGTYTLPADTAGTCKPQSQSEDTLKLPQDPKPASQSDLDKCFALTEPSPLSEDNNLEQARPKSPPLQPQIEQDMKDTIAKLVYGPVLSEALKSVNQNYNSSGYYQDQNLDVLQQELCALIDRKEDENGHKDVNDYITNKFIVHSQRVNQLLHILRVLLIPGGHGLLIGSERGTGRKTTVRLAASLMGYQLMEVHPGNEKNLHRILKEAGNQTRAEGVNVIILAHEGIQQSVREELLVAMANQTYPGLYTDEELRKLVSRLTAVKYSRRYLMDSWTFEKRLSKIHRNVHVFLLLPFTMPDSSETPANTVIHQWNAQLTKALSCSCCVEVYQPWSNQSLVEVAAQYLKTCPLQMERGGSDVSLSAAMAGIHQSACQYASVLLKAQPFSPQTYLEFITHFGYLCKHLHEQSQAYRVALSHLDVINNTAVEYKQELMRLQEKVAETQQHEKELLAALDYQMSRLEEAHKTCVEEENKLQCLEEEVIPVFMLGLKLQNFLNPSDLEEVHHYRDPPDGVVKIMDAICLLFNRPLGWETAKQLLGKPNFFQELEFFDRHTLTNEQLQQLGQIVHSPQFAPESVWEVSKACESLCRWVQAVYQCSCMQRDLLVKQQFERDVRRQLYLAIEQKTDATQCLKDVNLQLQLVRNELEEQMLELHEADSREREAARAAELLETHTRGLRAAAQEAQLNYQTLPGDALILAAVVSYLGRFAPDTRTELLSKWRELCQTGSIKLNPKDPRTPLFTHSDTESLHPLPGFPIPVSQRLQLTVNRALGIRQDAPSDRVIVKLLLWGCRRAWVQHWPLLADTQQHLDINSGRWLIPGVNSMLEKETESEMVVCADDPELLNKLDQAAVKGLRVMVTHVERAVPSPSFLARLARPAGCRSPGFQHDIQPTHREFSLILSTNLPAKMLNNDIHPSILAQVGVVDLSLSSEEIQELLLTQLLQSECKELLSQHLRFQNDKQLLQEKLVSEEDSLLDHILQSNTLLLKDSDALSRVAACQVEMKKLQADIQQLSDELERHESLLAVPRQLMRLAADLYQALQGVSRLSTAYHFSLNSFFSVMQEAFSVKGGPLVPYTVGKVPKEVITEVTNRMVTQLLLQYRPLLFKSHVAVLKLLVSVTLLQHNHLCSEAEGAAFIRGLQDMGHCFPDIKPCLSPPSISPSTSVLPSWIPPHTHPELLCLENMPGFEGLVASLSRYPTQWQEYLRFPSSTVAGPVPCRSHSHLSLLQRALLWKTMIPNCLGGLGEAMAAHHPFLPAQIQRTEAPHAGNPTTILQFLVKHRGPIILHSSGNEWTSIQPLPLINKLARCGAETKEIQLKVISFGALCDKDVILSMLDETAKDGHWLVFNNCHLLERWDDEVVARLSRLVSSLREEQSLIHPGFRLWFITQECASSCSIPGAVRMCALPLVSDSAWDLEEELSSSFQEAVSIVQSELLSGVTAENKELLLRCAVFHSVLLQRQSYKYLGQGRIYSWSQNDLLALMDAHLSISTLCHDKTQALHYIAVNLVHGGHVLDSADLEALESVAQTCFRSVSPLSGSGPQSLYDIISNSGNFDLSGLLQTLERDSTNINDPLMLGFSVETAAEMKKINSHHLNILLQASQTPVRAVSSLCLQQNQSASLPAYSQARDRLQGLKSYLAHKNDSTDSNAGAVSPSPLRDFLQAEWDELIDGVSLLLSQLQQPVRYGTATFTLLLEFTDLFRLERRAELLSAYLFHLNTSDPAGAYRLSAFKNARGFLGAVIREAARANHRNINDVVLCFQVQSDSTNTASLPVDAVYLCGLELRGALWDTQQGAIQDSISSQPCSLPLVCVKAEVRRPNTSKNIFSCEGSPTRGAQVSQSSAPQIPLYHCPLYLDTDRGSGHWGLADVNIITTVPLHAELNPVLCSLRRVRLVSML